MRIRSVCICVGALAVAAISAFGDIGSGIRDSGIAGGVIVHVGCGDGRVTAEPIPRDSFLVQGLALEADMVTSARKYIHSQGLRGSVTVRQFDGRHLPYIDDFVNLVIVENHCSVPEAEIVRILAPGGVAYVQGRKLIKPVPDEIDDWTHFLYGPDNNAVSGDSRVAAPRGIQWQGTPVWMRSHEQLASISAAVTANGRIYYIADTASPASLRFPPQWKLIARDAFNGKLLWEKSITQWVDHLRHFRVGPAHLPRRLVASGDRVFVTLGLAEPVSEIDGASGKILQTFTGTEYTEEILVDDGTVYLAVGSSEVQREGGGLHTRGEPEPSGHRCIVAYDIDSGKKLWERSFEGDDVLLPLTLGVRDGRAFYQSTAGVGCIDSVSGADLWLAPRVTLARRMGFSTPTLVAAEGVVLCADRRIQDEGDRRPYSGGPIQWGVNGWNEAGYPRRGPCDLIAYDSATGEKLWSTGCGETYNSPPDVLVVGSVVWVLKKGAYTGHDIRTGTQVKSVGAEAAPVSMGHHRCHRNRATGNYIYTGRSGIELISLEDGWQGNNSWIRGACQYGTIPANGFLYAPPDACACNIKVKVRGFFAANTSERGIYGGMPEPAPGPLLKGPAFQKIGISDSGRGGEDWPMYRGNYERSGRADCTISNLPRRIWSAELEGGLTQSIAVGSAVYVASKDTHTIYALDADSGKQRWSFIAGGRIDSPPAVYRGSLIFGCADGRVYSLRASDGELAWCFRAAPREKQTFVYGQLESVWPVHGSVLIQGGSAYVLAGRNSYLDGGLLLYRLDPMTGEVLARNVISHIDPTTGKQTGEEQKGGGDMEGVRSDILVGDGESVFLKHFQFDSDCRQVKTTDPHLLTAGGFSDQLWFVRDYWLVGTDLGCGWGGWDDAAQMTPFGRILAFDDTRIYGYGRVKVKGGKTGHTADSYHLFCRKKVMNVTGRKKAVSAMKLSPETAETYWADTDSLTVRSMVLLEDKLVVAGVPDAGRRKPDLLAFENPDEAMAAFSGAGGVFLRVISASDGKLFSEEKLGGMPVLDGMSAARNRIYISLENGTIECWQ